MAAEEGYMSLAVRVPLGRKMRLRSGDDTNFVKSPLSLQELCSRVVGQTHPFELVQQHQPRVPEELQKRIAFWSFPLSERQVLDHASLMMGLPDYEFESRVSMVGYSTKEFSEMLQTGRIYGATAAYLKTCASLVWLTREGFS